MRNLQEYHTSTPLEIAGYSYRICDVLLQKFNDCYDITYQDSEVVTAYNAIIQLRIAQQIEERSSEISAFATTMGMDAKALLVHQQSYKAWAHQQLIGEHWWLKRARDRSSNLSGELYAMLAEAADACLHDAMHNPETNDAIVEAMMCRIPELELQMVMLINGERVAQFLLQEQSLRAATTKGKE